MDSEEHTGNRVEKRKKKPNFTTRELTIITENVEASKFTDNVTNKTKTETWKAITEKVNAVGVASRTIYEVKQKWKRLFSTDHNWEAVLGEEGLFDYSFPVLIRPNNEHMLTAN